MSDVKPGTLIDATARRDAIHVALAPVIAGERLVPGAHVGFLRDDDQQKVGGAVKRVYWRGGPLFD